MVARSEKASKVSDSWKENWLPIGADVDDNLLVLDEKGRVREWDNDDESLSIARDAESYGTYLEHFRDKLCSGRMEYIAELGVVECMNTSPAKRSK